MKITLRWTDDHESSYEVDLMALTAGTIIVPTSDGEFHHFRPMNKTDKNGHDIHKEEPPS